MGIVQFPVILNALSNAFLYSLAAVDRTLRDRVELTIATASDLFQWLPVRVYWRFLNVYYLLIAKFHYTSPTRPDPTRPGSPTKSADFVWSGQVGPV